MSKTGYYIGGHTVVNVSKETRLHPSVKLEIATAHHKKKAARAQAEADKSHEHDLKERARFRKILAEREKADSERIARRHLEKPPGRIKGDKPR